MEENTFIILEKKIETYKYTSFKYLDYDDIKDYEVVLDKPDILLIYGFNTTAQISEIIFACNNIDVFLNYMTLYPNTLVKFIPESWHQKLKQLNYSDYAMMRDHWLSDLSSFNYDDSNIITATPKDAQEISDITRENAGISRAFYGDSKAFVETWIDGTNPSLTGMNARHNKVYLYLRDQKILGVALTCIYADDHPKGAVLWLREIAVRKTYHNQGIGRKLIMYALSDAKNQQAKRSFLMTDDLNIHAKHLYESIGFVPKTDEAQIDMISPK